MFNERKRLNRDGGRRAAQGPDSHPVRDIFKSFPSESNSAHAIVLSVLIATGEKPLLNVRHVAGRSQRSSIESSRAETRRADD